jgi:hypothetical protein
MDNAPNMSLHESERVAELQRAVERWAETVAPRLLRVLCPIYREGIRRPDPGGSGVLIRVDELIFLVSAAHVVDDVGRGPRYFGAVERTIPLPAFTMTTPIPSGGTRDDDRLDLGYWILDPKTAALMSSADTLRLTDLDIQDVALVTRDADYFLNGYPETRQPRKIMNGEVEAHTLAFLTEEVADEEYLAAGRDRGEHLLVQYSKADFYSAGVKKVGPDLQGVSGGAIWRLSGNEHASYDKPVLAAFVGRWRQAEPKCVIATRAVEWVKHAAREFPLQFRRELDRLQRSRSLQPKAFQ